MYGREMCDGHLDSLSSIDYTMIVITSREFDEWLFGLGPWEMAKVDDRLDRIRDYDHFGDTRFLGNRLWELRWRSGRRVYCAVIVAADANSALMLLGGDKDGQDRDIAQARRILEGYRG
jgi:putative addiction module killer protein